MDIKTKPIIKEHKGLKNLDKYLIKGVQFKEVKVTQLLPSTK